MSKDIYLRHPCEDLKDIDNIVKKIFDSLEFKEEFCINIDLNNIINKKKYFIFNLSQILDKRKLYNLIDKCISYFGYNHFKKDISKYLKDTCGFGLEERISQEEAEMFFAVNDISNFIIKYDIKKSFNIYISEKVLASSLKDYNTLSIKDNKIQKKTYNLLDSDAIKSSINSIVEDRDIYAITEKDRVDFSVQEKSGIEDEAIFIPKFQDFISPKFATSYISYESDQSIGIYYRYKEAVAEPLENILNRWSQTFQKDSKDALFWECFFSFALYNSTKKLHRLKKFKFNLGVICFYIYILRKRNKLKLLDKLYKKYNLLKFFSFRSYDTSFIDAQRAIDKNNVYKYMRLLFNRKDLIHKISLKNLFSLNLINNNSFYTKNNIDFKLKNIAIRLDKDLSVNIRNINYLVHIIESNRSNNFFIYSDQYQFAFFKSILNYPNLTVVNSLKNIKLDQIVPITSLYLNTKHLNGVVKPKQFNIYPNIKGTRKIGINLTKSSKFLSSLTNASINLKNLKDIINLYNRTSILFFDLSGSEEKNLFALEQMPKSFSLLEKCHYLQHLDVIITFDNEDVDLYNFLNIKTYLISQTDDAIRWNKNLLKNNTNLKLIKSLDQETLSSILDDSIFNN